MTTQLEQVREDIDNILDVDNEFSSTITYTKITNTYDDDGSSNSNTSTDYEIIANIHPESNESMKIDDLGQVIFGTALVFFKYQYTINSVTITPANDDTITFNSVKYRIKQLKPWSANGGVAYYEGKLVREDLN